MESKKLCLTVSWVSSSDSGKRLSEHNFFSLYFVVWFHKDSVFSFKLDFLDKFNLKFSTGQYALWVINTDHNLANIIFLINSFLKFRRQKRGAFAKAAIFDNNSWFLCYIEFVFWWLFSNCKSCRKFKYFYLAACMRY